MAKPETQFRAGNVSASIFVNEYEDKEILNVVLQKSYKKDGKWENTGSLGINDIPKAMLVLDKAYEYGLTRKQEKKEDINENPF